MYFYLLVFLLRSKAGIKYHEYFLSVLSTQKAIGLGDTICFCICKHSEWSGLWQWSTVLFSAFFIDNKNPGNRVMPLLMSAQPGSLDLEPRTTLTSWNLQWYNSLKFSLRKKWNTFSTEWREVGLPTSLYYVSLLLLSKTDSLAVRCFQQNWFAHCWKKILWSWFFCIVLFCQCGPQHKGYCLKKPWMLICIPLLGCYTKCGKKKQALI